MLLYFYLVLNFYSIGYKTVDFKTTNFIVNLLFCAYVKANPQKSAKPADFCTNCLCEYFQLEVHLLIQADYFISPFMIITVLEVP